MFTKFQNKQNFIVIYVGLRILAVTQGGKGKKNKKTKKKGKIKKEFYNDRI